MRKSTLAPSLLAADFSRVGETLKILKDNGITQLHLDVMDGTFVPNISLGMTVISSIRKCTDLKFDVHLMVQEPDRFIDSTAESGADLITVHSEACRHIDRVLDHIRELGLKSGIALSPATSLSCLDYVLPKADMVLLMSVNPGYGGQPFIPYVLDKVRTLRERIDREGLSTKIEVDGGVRESNLLELREAGVDVLVSGAAIFEGDLAANIQKFRSILES